MTPTRRRPHGHCRHHDLEQPRSATRVSRLTSPNQATRSNGPPSPHSIIASCIPTLKHLFERTLRRLGLLTTLNSQTRSGYLKHDEYTRPHSRALSALRPTTTVTVTVKPSKAGGGVDTSSLESAGPSPTYFKTAVRGGGGADEGSEEHILRHGGRGIQLETTVSVRSSVKRSEA